MKHLFILIILNSLSLLSFSQISNQEIEFEILDRDTLYVENAITGKLEYKILLHKGRINKFQGRKVLKMSAVNKPAYLTQDNPSIKSVLEAHFESAWSTFQSGGYTILIDNLLISSKGTMVYHECIIPKKEPFHYVGHFGGIWNKHLIAQTKAKIKEILKKQKWNPARNKAKAVDAYFDKTIEIIVEIK